MDKRGFIKTLEAVLAIMIVFIFIYSMSQRTRGEEDNTELMTNIQEGLLKGISQDEIFRGCIVAAEDYLAFDILVSLSSTCKNKDGKNIREYVETTLPERFVKGGTKNRYELQICDAGDTERCILPSSLEGKKYLYTGAVIVSSDFEAEDPYNPRILRIWMW